MSVYLYSFFHEIDWLNFIWNRKRDVRAPSRWEASLVQDAFEVACSCCPLYQHALGRGVGAGQQLHPLLCGNVGEWWLGGGVGAFYCNVNSAVSFEWTGSWRPYMSFRVFFFVVIRLVQFFFDGISWCAVIAIYTFNIRVEIARVELWTALQQTAAYCSMMLNTTGGASFSCSWLLQQLLVTQQWEWVKCWHVFYTECTVSNLQHMRMEMTIAAAASYFEELPI